MTLEVGTRVRVNDKYADLWEENARKYIGRTGTIIMMSDLGRVDVLFPRHHPRGTDPVLTLTNLDCLEPVDERPEAVVPLPSGEALHRHNQMASPDHWIHVPGEHGYTPPPPMPLRMGAGPQRAAFQEKVVAAARWAVKAGTGSGRDMVIDPDDMVVYFIVGLIGYDTATGLGASRWENPEPVPPEFQPPEETR
jgi:hypothetical protein